jgi:hypothetical protein
MSPNKLEKTIARMGTPFSVVTAKNFGAVRVWRGTVACVRQCRLKS